MNGLWLKCPTYIYEFIVSCVEKKYTFTDIVGECLDKETKGYICTLLQKLQEIDVITFDADELEQSTKIDSVTIEITTGCNLRCSHCCVACGDIPRVDMDIEDIRQIINWCESKKVSNISFTGGEIFIRKDIMEILGYARNHFNGNIEIMTNGTLLKDNNVSQLKDLVNYVSISLDGYDNESVNEIRGKGVFNKVVKAVRIMQDSGLKDISLSMVLTKQNAINSQHFRELCKNLNVKPAMRVFSPEGRGNDNYSTLVPQIKLVSPKELDEEGRGELQETINFKSICNLNTKILICSDGKIFPCFLTKKGDNAVGNIEDLFMDSLLKINSMPVVDVVENCKYCNVRYFCASACPGHDNTIFTNEKYRTELCSQVRTYYEDVAWG